MEFIYRCRGTIPPIDVERGIVMVQASYQVDVKGVGKIKVRSRLSNGHTMCD